MIVLKRHAAQLMEHFDSVQIFATRHLGDQGTVHATYGAGNWFARFGHVNTWVEKEREGFRVDARHSPS